MRAFAGHVVVAELDQHIGRFAGERLVPQAAVAEALRALPAAREVLAQHVGRELFFEAEAPAAVVRHRGISRERDPRFRLPFVGARARVRSRRGALSKPGILSTKAARGQSPVQR